MAGHADTIHRIHHRYALVTKLETYTKMRILSLIEYVCERSLNWNTTFPAVTVCEIYSADKIWELNER